MKGGLRLRSLALIFMIYVSVSASFSAYIRRLVNRVPSFLKRPLSKSTMFHDVYDKSGTAALEQLCSTGNDQPDRLIRVEKGRESSTWNSVRSRDQVLLKLEEARNYQAEYGESSLYKRKWERLTNTKSSPISSDSAEASSRYVPQKQDDIFSALQFNMLAEGLSSGPNVDVPFSPLNEDENASKGSYGGFTAIPHKEIALDFQMRRWRLLEVLLGEDGTAPFDVLALEEIDRFAGFFRPALDLFGYDGIFFPKPKSPGAKLGWYSDGCGLFWKRDAFCLVRRQEFEYKVGNQVLVIATLRHRKTNQNVVFAVTHLKAQKQEQSEKVRRSQVKELLEFVDDAVATSRTPASINVPVLLMGDFNADPPSENQDSYSQSALSAILKDDMFRSVYDISPPTDGFYTTWKIRGTTDTKRVIDYIFYSQGIQCNARLKIPAEDEIDSKRLPGLRYPSDHFAIGAVFRIAKK